MAVIIEELLDSFTKRFDCKKLFYYKQYENMMDAFEREKQIKGGSRKKKLAFIESKNNDWEELYLF